MAQSKLKPLLNKMIMIQLSEQALLEGVKEQLEGRESFKDTDSDLDECIYSSDVFEAILGENAQLEEGHMFKIDKESEAQLEELSKLCGKSQYVQITKA